MEEQTVEALEEHTMRRICRFVNRQHQDLDLRDFADIIITTIEETVPDKHPRVYSDHFSTDILTHGEAVRIGSALSRVKQLQPYGTNVTQFRLFRGKTIPASADVECTISATEQRKGGPRS